MNYLFTSESVSEGHPDKVADQISDAVLDEFLARDPQSKVACETMVTTGQIIVAGEIRSEAYIDIMNVAREVACTIGYDRSELGFDGSSCGVLLAVHEQSPDINRGVDREQPEQQGAGDQGIMYGYACSETPQLLPLPVVLAHQLTLLLTNARKTGTIQGLGPDGKAQVSVEYQNGKPHRIAAVVVSCQHDEAKNLDELRREITRHVIVPGLRELYPDPKTEVFVNPSGRFVLGGFEADTGLTGRKLMADTYGGLALHGGGALSGKDGSKVDRSGVYMARCIAKNIVAAGLAEKCTISLAYAIGRAEPVAVDIDTHQTGKYAEAVLEQAVRAVFDLTPAGMISALGLDRPIFARFCNYGHFTHRDAPWEQTDRAAVLVDAVGGDRSNG